MWFVSAFSLFFFFFNDTATTEIYTLSLHDALPISNFYMGRKFDFPSLRAKELWRDRKSTRLNSSHLGISYAVFCLKKKKKIKNMITKQKKNKKHKKKKKINTK